MRVTVHQPGARGRDTLVTAIYESGPDSAIGGRGRLVESYFLSLSSIVALGAPVVVYTQPDRVERVAQELRGLDASGIVVGRPLESVRRFEQIQEIRTRQRFHTQPHRDRCHVLCHAKLGWVAEQAVANPFASERFYWIDAGLVHRQLFPSRHLPPDGSGRCTLFAPRVLDALASPDVPSRIDQAGSSEASLVMLGRPLAAARLHQIGIEAHLPFLGNADASIETHVVGGLFGGARDAVLSLSAAYDGVLDAMLDADLLGTEENVLTILYHRDRSRARLLSFTTWYHEETEIIPPGPDDVPFYRIFERLADPVAPPGPPAPGEWYPRAVGELTWREVDGAFMLSCAGDDRVHVLNHVGVILLELANGRHSVPEMTVILQQAFALDDPPEAEVRGFLERAVQARLVR